jgi:hypothetical protein
MPIVLLSWCVAAFLATAVAAIATARSAQATRIIYGASLAISCIALGIAVFHAAASTAPVSMMTLPLGLPWLGAHLRLDALAAFFLLVVNLGGAAASLYGLGYGRHEPAPHRILPFFPAFLAGMNLVVLADDAFTFLLSWEFMSLGSWALVMAHHQEEDNRRAGYIYLVMASFGTLALLLAFSLLSGPEGGYDFATIRSVNHTPIVTAVVLLLMLLGAGSKAGLVPLHVWLPLAHPAAPSHVSALMSGVMTKVAVYGFIRVVFNLLGEPTWWSSAIVLSLGGATAVLGILYALMEKDIKRPQSLLFQEPAFLRRGRGADGDGRTRHGEAGRLDPSHAGHQLPFPRRLHGDIGPAALERFRVGMAGFPGDPAKSEPAAMGTQDHGAGGRRHAGAFDGAGRGLFRQGVRRDVSRPAPDFGCGRGTGGRSLLDCSNGGMRCPLPPCRDPAWLRD